MIDGDDHPLLGVIDNPVNKFGEDFAASLFDESPDPLSKPDSSLQNDVEDIPGYNIIKIIGIGAEAVVYEAVDEELGVSVALKRYTLVQNVDISKPREIIIAEALDHLHCLQFHRSFQSAAGNFILAMPLALSGSIKITALPEITVMGSITFLHQIGSALAHMHSRDIVHRDIKPGNILYFDHGYVLCDYSISIQLTSPDELVSGIAGTSVFMAPEISVNMYAPKPVDVWALGITVYGLLCGRYPWGLNRILEGGGAAGGQNAAKNEISGELTFPRVPYLPPELTSIITRMLDMSPESRMTAAELAEHEWLISQVTDWSRIVAFVNCH
jgi:serine/threonine protein kinase